MQNLQICGLGFIALCIMYYLLIDVFEKSKRLRQSVSLPQEPSVSAVAVTVAVNQIAPPIKEVAGVYPMYIDCSRSEAYIPANSNDNLTLVSI